MAALGVELEDQVHDAILALCARRQITPNQLVTDHLRSILESVSPEGDGQDLK